MTSLSSVSGILSIFYPWGVCCCSSSSSKVEMSTASAALPRPPSLSLLLSAAISPFFPCHRSVPGLNHALFHSLGLCVTGHGNKCVHSFEDCHRDRARLSNFPCCVVMPGNQPPHQTTLPFPLLRSLCWRKELRVCYYK